MTIIDRPLPSMCYPGRPLHEVGAIVQHYISAINVNQHRPFDPDVVYDLFVDLNHVGSERGLVMRPEPGGKRYYASAHYLIARDGVVYRLVDEAQVAWHAGKSKWKGRTGLNEWSIGIEWIGAHPDDIKRYGLDPTLADFTDEQYAAGQQLNAELMSRHGVALDDVTGHEFVAPGRKKDPGPRFDWERLKEPLRYVL
jgi:hypothetical protein